MTVAVQSIIEQEITIRAPRARVWKALTTPSDFGAFFRAKVNAQAFRVGEAVEGVSTYPGCEGKAFTLRITEVVPNERFSWQWRPGASSADEPDTTVTFTLKDVSGGTRVTVTESGFDRISLERRAKAFEGNNEGWKIQLKNLQTYVENA